LYFRTLVGENGHHGRSGRHVQGKSLIMNLRKCELF